MTQEQLDLRHYMLFQVQDLISLRIEEISIFNEMVNEHVCKLCSLDQEAGIDSRLNAEKLVRDQPKLNMLSVKITESVEHLQTVYDFLIEVIHDLYSGEASPTCEKLYKEVLGGSFDD